MTLNITVLTHSKIYQSSDFRLSIDGRPSDNSSAKSVMLTYQSWICFVTYTGLGEWDTRYISDWIAKWLTGIKDLTMVELANLLANKGTKLLDSVYYATGKRIRHTFTLAGFDGGDVVVFVVSNFESCFGEIRNTPDNKLKVSSRKLRNVKKARIIVTGCKDAVPINDRRVLSSLAAKYSMDSGRIRRRIEALNANAASLPNFRDLVSKDCVVISFSSDGSGILQLNLAAEEVPTVFPHISFGTDTTQMMVDAMRAKGFDLTNMRIVQGAFASNARVGAKTIPVPHCQLGVAIPDPSADYHLTEIKSSAFEPMYSRDINDIGQIVGTGRLTNGAPCNIPWVWESGAITQLNYNGLAQRISEDGHIVATLQEMLGERAGIYQNGSLTEFPLYHGKKGIFNGTDSAAFAINSSNVIVGRVRSRTEEKGRPNTRAAIFHTGQAPLVLMELDAEFGCDAVDINDSGIVLLKASPIYQSQSLLWDPKTGAWFYIGATTLNVYPVALNNEGTVLGQARNHRNDPIAVICKPGDNWERLGTDDGWAPISMNDRGDVVGIVSIDSIQRPWIRFFSGEVILLPYIIEHHTAPSSINNIGQIVGTAVADHGSHAILWQPSTS